MLCIYIELQTDRQLEQWRHASLLYQIRQTANPKKVKPPAPPPLVKRRFNE